MAFLRVGVAATLVLLVGCAVEADEPALDDDATAAGRPAYGIVTVERVEGEGLSRASVSAKFMRVAPADRALAEDLVSARAVVPNVGECASLDSLEGLSVTRLTTALGGADGAPALPQGFALELLDVGDVSLVVHASGGDRPLDGDRAFVPLAPRAFPDVGDLASGVFYSTPDATLPMLERATSAYELTGSGAASVDSFLLDVGALPEHPTAVRVEQRGHELAVSWAPRTTDASDEVGASVYIDVLGTEAFRCSFADDGNAVLPAGVLAASDRGREATVAVHRITERVARLRHASDRTVTDLEDAEARVRFDLAATVRFSVR